MAANGFPTDLWPLWNASEAVSLVFGDSEEPMIDGVVGTAQAYRKEKLDWLEGMYRTFVSGAEGNEGQSPSSPSPTSYDQCSIHIGCQKEQGQHPTFNTSASKWVCTDDEDGTKNLPLDPCRIRSGCSLDMGLCPVYDGGMWKCCDETSFSCNEC